MINPKIQIVSAEAVNAIIKSGACFAYLRNSIRQVRELTAQSNAVLFDYKTTTYAFIK